jgi:hypothetical protein
VVKKQFHAKISVQNSIAENRQPFKTVAGSLNLDHPILKNLANQDIDTKTIPVQMSVDRPKIKIIALPKILCFNNFKKFFIQT